MVHDRPPLMARCVTSTPGAGLAALARKLLARAGVAGEDDRPVHHHLEGADGEREAIRHL